MSVYYYYYYYYYIIVLRLRVKEGYFFSPPKRVTSPTWGPPTPCKQALSVNYYPSDYAPQYLILSNLYSKLSLYFLFPKRPEKVYKVI